MPGGLGPTHLLTHTRTNPLTPPLCASPPRPFPSLACLRPGLMPRSPSSKRCAAAGWAHPPLPTLQRCIPSFRANGLYQDMRLHVTQPPLLAGTDTLWRQGASGAATCSVHCTTTALHCMLILVCLHIHCEGLQLGKQLLLSAAPPMPGICSPASSFLPPAPPPLPPPPACAWGARGGKMAGRGPTPLSPLNL